MHTNQSNPLVSVIIPIYNTMPYLAQCLDSILAQSYTHLEIILINDGSTDGSEEIALSYARQDSRILYIYQENQGGGAAKNTGLQKATGEWVIFVDSDDYIGGGHITAMLECALLNQLDYVHNINAVHFKNGENMSALPQATWIKPYTLTRQNLQEMGTKMLGAVWNCCFKKDIIDALALRFVPRLRHEDEVFIMSYLPFCKNAAFIKGGTYFYRQSAASLMGQLRAKQLQSMEYIQAFCEVIAYYEKTHLIKNYDLPFHLIRGRSYYDCFCNPRFKNAPAYFALAKSKLSQYPQHYFDSDKLTLAIIKCPHLICYRCLEGYHRGGLKEAFKSLFRIRISKKLTLIVLFGIRIYSKDSVCDL